MRKQPIFIALAFALVVASPAWANRLIEANRAARIDDSALSVTPTQDWNRLSARPGRSAETWTLDGEALNNLTFYAGVEDGRTLIREVDRRNRPLPRFSATMLLADIPTFLENSYRAGRGVTIFTTDRVEPVQFAGRSGMRLSYSFVADDEVRRRGEAYSALVGGRLYMITFEAPAIYFFDAYIEPSRQVIASASIGAAR